MKIRKDAAESDQNKMALDTSGEDFFDAFTPEPASLEAKKAAFNETTHVSDDDCVNGAELLALAAAAVKTRWVIYDLPRNTNRTGLGKAALAAGYRGNIRLDEHYLNGRGPKTITAYCGADFCKDI